MKNTQIFPLFDYRSAVTNF